MAREVLNYVSLALDIIFDGFGLDVIFYGLGHWLDLYRRPHGFRQPASPHN